MLRRYPLQSQINPELTDLGGNATHIGRTEKGDLMLHLNKSNKTADSFHGQIEKMLHEQVEVKARKLEK